MNRAALEKQIRELGPWHHDIQINDELSTGRVFSETGTLLRDDNDGVTLISPRRRFVRELELLFPNGMAGTRFLDCACNAGGYCFWAREFGAEFALGFDVREHWIQQGQFVQEHRTAGPTDALELKVLDLYDFPKLEYEDFDLTYFSGIFYHLPDPVTGLKIAADRTRDVLVLNTAVMPPVENEENLPGGMTLAMESHTNLMSGVHTLSWIPNSPKTLEMILKWLGFNDIVLVTDNRKSITKINKEGQLNPDKPALRRRRVGIYAARKEGRLDMMRAKAEASPKELGKV